MNRRDQYYIELTKAVHLAVVNWDPLGLISGGAPADEYDTIEKRFLSGIINGDTNEYIIQKVKLDLEYYGVDFRAVNSTQLSKLEVDITSIFTEVKSLP